MNRMVSKNRESLRETIRERALLRDGPYPLYSGVSSDYFFYMKSPLNDGRDLLRIALLVLNRLPKETTAVGGKAIGSVPISSAIIALNEEHRVLPRTLRGFWLRNEAKDHGPPMARWFDGDIDRDDKVVVVDDVTTSGSSVMDAVKAVRSLGAEILKVIAIVDREAGAGKRIRSEGIEFESLFQASDILDV